MRRGKGRSGTGVFAWCLSEFVGIEYRQPNNLGHPDEVIESTLGVSCAEWGEIKSWVRRTSYWGEREYHGKFLFIFREHALHQLPRPQECRSVGAYSQSVCVCVCARAPYVRPFLGDCALSGVGKFGASP